MAVESTRDGSICINVCIWRLIFVFFLSLDVVYPLYLCALHLYQCLYLCLYLYFCLSRDIVYPLYHPFSSQLPCCLLLYLFNTMQFVFDETITHSCFISYVYFFLCLWFFSRTTPPLMNIWWLHRVFACGGDNIKPSLMQLILESIKSCWRHVIAFWCCFENIF